MSKSACQTPCQLASCFFIFLTHSFFSSFPFLFFFFFFVLHKTCQSGNWCNVCMQIISASNWVERKNLIFEVPCCSPFFFFNASLNKKSFHYLQNDFCNSKVCGGNVCKGLEPNSGKYW